MFSCQTAFSRLHTDGVAFQWPTVALHAGVSYAMLREVDPLHGTLGPTFDSSPLLPGLQLRIAPGMARLFVITRRSAAADKARQRQKSDDTRPAGWRCQCANSSLCAPLTTPPADKEVFAYWEMPSPSSTGLEGMEQLFTDSALVTTIAVCEGNWQQELAAPVLPDELLCYAHGRGVRVVVGCVGCDVWSSDTHRCPGHSASTPYDFNDTAARKDYVEALSSYTHDQGYDGVSLDMEGGIAKEQESGLTALVQEVRASLPAAAQLSFASACLLTPKASSYGYNWTALAEATDFLFPMC